MKSRESIKIPIDKNWQRIVFRHLVLIHMIQSLTLSLTGIIDSMAAGRFFGEDGLAVNAIQHNAKLKHPLHLHVRFAITEKQLVLRLRDQGRPYDLTRAYSMIKPDDPSSHIGLRLVYANAEEVTWSSFFQMNNICIRLAAKRKDDNSTETAFAKE